jgi:hypothetical protein
MYDELGRIWTEVVMTCSWHYTEETQITSLRISDNLDETETRHVSMQVKNLNSTPNHSAQTQCS